jgi:hypothetical protein
MTFLIDSPPPPSLDDLDAQAAFFRENSYVVLPDLLSPDTTAAMNEAIDRDRRDHPFLWFCEGERDYNCNLLLTEPIFEGLVRHPKALPLVERLMGGPVSFEELSVRHTGPKDEDRPTGWHRDRPYWEEHPLRLDYPQIILYTTDVDASTHCFTISPEPAAGPTLEPQAHRERGGILNFYGRAGSAILFNCATLHGVTHRKTPKRRRTVQVYYGHPHRPSLSQVTLMPPRLWRDHPDPEVRRFYGKLNRYTRVWLQSVGIEVPNDPTPL